MSTIFSIHILFLRINLLVFLLADSKSCKEQEWFCIARDMYIFPQEKKEITFCLLELFYITVLKIRATVKLLVLQAVIWRCLLPVVQDISSRAYMNCDETCLHSLIEQPHVHLSCHFAWGCYDRRNIITILKEGTLVYPVYNSIRELLKSLIFFFFPFYTLNCQV